MTKRQILARVGLLIAFLTVSLAFLPHDATLIVGRLVALITAAHLIWRYHRLADWSRVEVGRSTMAIKGSILLLALGANLHSLTAYTTADLGAIPDGSIIIGWLCLAGALVHRDRLVVRYQREAHALPAPPPPHYLPSEGIKREEQP